MNRRLSEGMAEPAVVKGVPNSNPYWLKTAFETVLNDHD
jgi:hypothetical protein